MKQAIANEAARQGEKDLDAIRHGLRQNPSLH